MNQLVASKLPRCIFHHAAGYRVRVIRGALKLEAYFPLGENPTPEHQVSTLNRAIALRDRFLIAAGPTLPKLVKAYKPTSRRRSNTGHPGITESVKYVRYYPLQCFTVYLGKKHRPQMKRVYFGVKRTREQALKQAMALRASVVPRSDSRTPSSKEAAHV